jgi:hypothetical protein
MEVLVFRSYAFQHALNPSYVGERCPLLESFASFVKNIEAMFQSRRFASLNEVSLKPAFFLCSFDVSLAMQMRKHCIASSQSAQCEWVAIAKQTQQSALVEHLLNLLVDALSSLSFSVPAVTVKTESDAAQPAPVCKVERAELVTVSDGAAPPTFFLDILQYKLTQSSLQCAKKCCRTLRKGAST